MNKKILVAISFGVVVLAIIVVYYLGYVAVVFKSPDQELALRYNVCGKDDVEAINKVDLPLEGEGREVVEKIIQRIDKDKHGRQDPTCQMIRFIYGRDRDDIEVMKDSLGYMERLAEEGNFADPRMLGGAYVLGQARGVVDE